MALYRGKEGEQILSFLVQSITALRERDGQIFTFVASEDDIRFLQAVREDVRAHHYVRVREVLGGKTRVRRRTIDGVCFGDGENERQPEDIQQALTEPGRRLRKGCLLLL